jgi:hypothetical protein
MVAGMETTGDRSLSDSPDPRASLQEARDAGDAVRRIDTPWWYFVLSAGLFAALILAQLLGDRSVLAMIAVGIGIVALNMLAARKAGVIGSASRNSGFIAVMVLIFLVTVGSLAWYGAAGEPWIVVASAAAVALLMLVGGWLYRRNPS